MKKILEMAVTALVLVAFAAHGGTSKKDSLKQKVVGTWKMVGNVHTDAGGNKTEPFGPGPKGSVTLTSGGRLSLIITRADLPKFASNVRTTGTPEENQAVVAGSIAYFGSYTVNEADKVLVVHIEGSTFPNWVGTDQKRNLELSGDEMKFTNQAPSMGQGTITVTWKRVKDATTTASR